MRDAVGERRSVEQRRGEHVQRVEPAAGLADVLADEIRREVLLEPLRVLERVVQLREGHRAGLEPAVEDVFDAPHRRAARRVVGVRPGEGVDPRAVEVVGADAEIGGQLVEAPVDVDAGVVRVVALPDRDGRPPEAVA